MSSKENILDAALGLFVKHGFQGTSMSQIAKKAAVNQSLIYHHFASKEALWSAVKKHCVDQATQNCISPRFDTLQNFLEDIIEIRLSVYAQSPMGRLVHWQALEANTSRFYETLQAHPMFDINDHVVLLQNKSLIRDDEEAVVLTAMIFSLTSYAFFDFSNVFNLSPLILAQYKQCIYMTLLNALTPNPLLSLTLEELK